MLFRPLALAVVASVLGMAACTSEAGAPDATGEADQTGDKVLLDCNVFEGGGGPDQQVTVVQRKDALVLKELTNHGSMVERPLSAAEWTKKEIKLRSDGYGSKSRIWKESDGWINESISPGWKTVGFADCWVDKSK